MKHLTSETYSRLFEEIKTIPNIRKREENLFSLGAKGYYENPTSDLLAFYLDPHKGHNLGSLVFRCLLESVDVDTRQALISDVDSILAVHREVRTSRSNRLDIIIEAMDFVFAIENKIFHTVENPLDDYTEFIRSRYPQKRHFSAILSLTGDTPDPLNWPAIKYADLLSRINNEIANEGNENKWVIFLRELVLNINQYVGSQTMDAARLQFYETHANEIAQLEMLRKEYEDYVSSTPANMPSGIFQQHKHLTIAVRFKTTKDGILLYYANEPLGVRRKPSQWVPILYVGKDGKLRAQVWHGKVSPMISVGCVNDGKEHEAKLEITENIQRLMLDGVEIAQLSGMVNHLEMKYCAFGFGYYKGWPEGKGGWNKFQGELLNISIWKDSESAENVIFRA